MKSSRSKVSLTSIGTSFLHVPLILNLTTLVDHAIDTGSHKPKWQALRRHPRAHLEIDIRLLESLENYYYYY